MLKRLSWVALLMLVGILSRWLPHPPNFTALFAIALFAGAVLPGGWALALPVATAFLGDLWLGFHHEMWVVYLSLLPMVWLGQKLPPANKYPRTWLSWGFYGLLASVFFFITSNLAVWWYSGIYPHTEDGLVSCFILALPFFHNSVLSTWIYLGGFAAVQKLAPSLFPAPLARAAVK